MRGEVGVLLGDKVTTDAGRVFGEELDDFGRLFLGEAAPQQFLRLAGHDETEVTCTDEDEGDQLDSFFIKMKNK